MLKVVGVFLLLHYIFLMSLIGTYCTYLNGGNHLTQKCFVCAWYG